MNSRSWFLSSFRIAIPFLLAVFLPFHPLPVLLRQMLHDASQETRSSQEKVDDYQRILLWEPWRWDLYEKLGTLYFEERDFPSAVNYLHIGDQQNGLTAEGRKFLCLSYLKSGDWALGNRCCIAASNLPGNENTWETCFNFYREQQTWRESRALLESLQSVHPELVEVQYQLGLMSMVDDPQKAYSLLIDLKDADLSFDNKIDSVLPALEEILQEPDPAVQAVSSGRELARLGDWDYAKSAFEYALHLKPDYAEAWAFLGEAQQQLGIDGLPALQTALHFDPTSELALSMLAIYYRRNAKPEIAYAYLQRLAQMQPDQGIWQVEISSTLIEMGDIHGALDSLKRAVEIEPSNLDYWQRLVQFCVDHRIEVRSTALPAARHSLLLSSQSAKSLDLMAQVLFILGDRTGAQRFLHQAYQIDATNAEVNYHLAEIYLLDENYEPARFHLFAAAQMTTKDDFTGMIVRRLLDEYSWNKPEDGALP